jgi:1-aminocyclopropane-1-carboxylate deaminase
VLLDPIYTAKMLYGLLEIIKNDGFQKGAKILAIHTGGLQGIQGVNQQLYQNNEKIIH